jgi:hypothetical protein
MLLLLLPLILLPPLLSTPHPAVPLDILKLFNYSTFIYMNVCNFSSIFLKLCAEKCLRKCKVVVKLRLLFFVAYLTLLVIIPQLCVSPYRTPL